MISKPLHDMFVAVLLGVNVFAVGFNEFHLLPGQAPIERQTGNCQNGASFVAQRGASIVSKFQEMANCAIRDLLGTGSRVGIDPAKYM